MSRDKQALKDSLQFMAETMAAYTNTLNPVVRKPFAEAAGRHMQTIVEATQGEPPKEKK